MNCPKCGTQNDTAGQRCVKCGAALTPGTSAVAAHVYAGFWKRFAAFIIDYIIVIILAMAGGAAVGFMYGAMTGTTSGAEGVGAIAGLIAFWLYYALMESSRTQATLGKMALGIRVTNQRGARISFGCATWRLFAKLLSGMILMIGYMMAGFTAKKQALHDMLADTLVVNKRATETELQAGVIAPTMPGWAIVLVVLSALIVPIGIMAAIAIPAYQDFAMRAKVADAMSAASTVRVSVMEYYEKHEKLPGGDLQALLKGTGATMPSSPHVRELTLDAGTARIRVVIGQGPLDGKSIYLTPRVEKKALVWQCRSNDVPQRYLSYTCRDAVEKP